MKLGILCNVVKAFIQKNSPYIVCGIGAASVAAGAVVIVNKAKKQDEFDEEIQKEYYEKFDNVITGDVDKNSKTYKKVIFKLNIWRARKYVRYYALPTILLSGGVMCMISALLIQTKRLKALSVAYTSLATAFNDYRERVKKQLGDEKEQEVFEGVERNKNGEIVSSSRTGVENDKTFSRLFGEGNSWRWVKNTNLCMLILKAAESNLNERLRINGFVTLNQVWEELGFKPSSEGMYLGWRFKKGDPVYGSTYIDLGYSGPKNKNKCEYYRGCWNEEMWIDVIPPHVLFDKLPNEKIRTENEKKKIKALRKNLGSDESDGSEFLCESDYRAEKTMADIRKADMMV